ncbi:MAG: hypothetical protein KKD94_01395, partial [Nanoarchaeota archaeon]|nr:hypothetical protein [Nanoarchaeota archaeon]MBU1988118.1 hypothetical protein [Nanoarchaeota archaeon]
LGPMGINLGKVIEDVNKATSGFKGVKVPVELDVDTKTKTYTIEVSSPPVAELIKKELKLEKASGEAGKNYAGNIAFETILGITKTKQDTLLAKDLRSAVKLVVGTCVSMGVLIDNKNGKEIEQEIEEGKYDDTIQNEKTSPSEEKKKELEEFWKEISTTQEKTKKAAEAAKAEEEAKKTEEAASAPATPDAGATPVAGADTGAKKEEPKKEEKGKKKK